MEGLNRRKKASNLYMLKFLYNDNIPFLKYFRTSWYFTEIGDTLSSNDVVIKQYESLPYPEFSESSILAEEEYYKTDVQNPKIFTPSHSLEKINHYFYAGDQNFR